MTRVSLPVLSSLLVALLFSSAPAYGQLQDISDRRVQVYVGGSPTYPFSTSDFEDFYQTGYTFIGGVGITLTPEWELSFQGAYSHFGLDDTLLPGGEGTLSVYAATMNLKHLFRKEGRWIPYFSAGFGVFHREEDDVTFDFAPRLGAPRSDATLGGAHMGAGLAVRMIDAMSLFIEPRYTATASFQNTDESTVDYAEVRMGLIVAPF
jgi:opacity protein-like surface antigen